MKVTYWGRGLAASLIAGGLMLPAPTLAAPLNTNLVVDPGFEDINDTTAEYDNRQLDSWADGTIRGFTYASGQYDLGGPLAGGGARYFTSNGGANATGPDQVAQRIDVGTGPSGGLIAAGEAAVKFGSFMTSYDEADTAFLHVRYLNAADVSLGTAQISDADNSTWTYNEGLGLIPAGTTRLQVSVYGVAGAGGPDGYQDNVDVRVVNAADVLLFLEVDAATGAAKLRNLTGAPVYVDYYEILSNEGAGASLNPAGWQALQNQALPGFPAGNGTGNGWEKAGGSDAGVLSESYLAGNSLIADQASIPLGTLFQPGAARNLTFRYGVVTGESALAADFDGDGVTDGGDLLAWQRGFPATFDAADFAQWASEFGTQGGPTGVSVLTTSFVRYVDPLAAATSAIPELSTFALAAVAFSSCLPRRRAARSLPR